MRTRLFLLVATTVPLIVMVAFVVSGTAFSSTRVKGAQNAGETFGCKFNITNPAKPPKKVTGGGPGTCTAYGPVADSLTATTQFKLIGLPPKAVAATAKLIGKHGTLNVQFQGPSVPVAFAPGPAPIPVAGVNLGKFTVTAATGGYAKYKGKSGVSGAYNDSRNSTLEVGFLLPG